MTIEDAINLNSEEKGVIDSIFNNGSTYIPGGININDTDKLKEAISNLHTLEMKRLNKK